MFAVPGWTVPASNLKAQQDPRKKNKNDKVNGSGNGEPAADEKKSKKRKRGHGNANGIEVTEDNIVEMWQKHIEGRAPAPKDGGRLQPEKSNKKRRRKQKSNDLLDWEEKLLRTSTASNWLSNQHSKSMVPLNSP